MVVVRAISQLSATRLVARVCALGNIARHSIFRNQRCAGKLSSRQSRGFSLSHTGNIKKQLHRRPLLTSRCNCVAVAAPVHVPVADRI